MKATVSEKYMTTPRIHAVARWALAALTAAAIITQLQFSLIVLHSNPINFFSYLTIQSNIIVIVALLVPQRRMLRGAATLYIAIVGIFFTVLLSGAAGGDSTIRWVNVVVHYVTPVAMVLDWLIDPAPLSANYAGITAQWLAYPVAYLAYTLIRGPIVRWYPYPFLDPATGGYRPVASVAAVILVTLIVVSLGLISYSRVANNRRARALQ